MERHQGGTQMESRQLPLLGQGLPHAATAMLAAGTLPGQCCPNTPIDCHHSTAEVLTRHPKLQLSQSFTWDFTKLSQRQRIRISPICCDLVAMLIAPSWILLCLPLEVPNSYTDSPSTQIHPQKNLPFPHSSLLLCLFCVYAHQALASYSLHAAYCSSKLHLLNSNPFLISWSL